MENIDNIEEEKQSLEDYYQGKNDPVADWFFNWYQKDLFFSAWSVLDNPHDVEIVLSDVMCKLLETEAAERRQKFRVENGNIKGALSMRVRNASLDLVRRHRPDLPVVLPEVESSSNFEKSIANKQCLEMFIKHLESNFTEKEVKFFALMLSYGTGQLNQIAQELGLNSEEARILQQRLKRNAKKFLISNGCGD